MTEKITLKDALSGLTQKADVDSIVARDSSGTPVYIKKSDLAKVMASLMPSDSLYDKLNDGVFIMYHRKSDSSTLMSKLSLWTGLQDKGETADGVVVVDDGRFLVVAPTEASTTLMWSSAGVSGGGTSTSEKTTALNDWNGKDNTRKQIAASAEGAVTSTESYAPGFCNLYSGEKLTAGQWWLPSMGELMMIFAHMGKINYALSLIDGADQLKMNAYWSSTEFNNTRAWNLNIGTGYPYSTAKTDFRLVRPVSAFI